MRDSLARWVRDADALHHLDYFRVEADRDLAYIRRRAADYYLTLVGELFDYLREPIGEHREWDRLGNALACFGAEGDEAPFPASGVSRTEANLFAACAFYCGGFPASAYVTVRTQQDPHVELGGASAACFDLLGRPRTMRSEVGRRLLAALRRGDMDRLAGSWRAARDAAREAFATGPEAWIPARLLERLLQQFLQTNLRAVLPDGGSEFWSPLIASLVDQNMWQFFPSQIEAIQRGLLDDTVAFALQMPTGAGKTALCETLFALRAQRVVEIQRAGRLGWIRDTGTCARMVVAVEGELLPQRERWDDVEGPLEDGFVGTMLEWAWGQRELQVAVRNAYRLKGNEDTGPFREQFFNVVRLWISGAPFVEIGRRAGLTVDDLLGVYTHVVGFALQTLIEQAVALLERLVGERGETVAEAVTEFPEHLRFGVGTAAGRVLAGRGLRHRRAAVEVGNVLTLRAVTGDRDAMTLAVRRELEQDPDGWSERLGVLVLRRTLEDLA